MTSGIQHSISPYMLSFGVVVDEPVNFRIYISFATFIPTFVEENAINQARVESKKGKY
jgi:hypothetical protein